MIEERLGVRAVPLCLPHRDDDRCLLGLVDLIHQEYLTWDCESLGTVIERQPIPEEMAEAVASYRERAIEAIAEADDAVMEIFVDGGEIPPDVLHEGVRRGCLSGELVPVLGGSAFQNVGIQPLLDAVVKYLPSPLDVPDVHAIEGDETRKADPSEPFSALAFKVAVDRYAGRLVFVRVYSGTLAAGGHAFNMSTEKGLRVTKIFRMHANRRDALEEMTAGDIIAMVGSQEIATGDTLCDKSAPILLEKIEFPEPVVFVAVEPRTEAEFGELMDSLGKLAQEDPTFRVQTDETTNQTILGGMGELHLEILIRRLREEFGMHAHVGRPQVAYRETLTEPIEVEDRFAKQVGGRGQYGHVVLKLEPLQRGSGIQFDSQAADEDVPKQYRSAIESALRGTLTNGPVAGYPLADIGATLVGGSYHPVDSSELAFRASTSAALHKAYAKRVFGLLEPIMEGEVITPGEYLGEVMEDLARRRGEIRELQSRETVQILSVSVPLAETFGYATRLRSLTQGRATYSLRVVRYDRVPEGLQNEIIKSRGY